MLSTIAIGDATLQSLEAAVASARDVFALSDRRDALGVMRWLASKHGCSFTGNDGVVTGNAGTVNVDPAIPFEFSIGQRAITFFLNPVGIGRLSGRDRIEAWLNASGIGLRTVVAGSMRELHADVEGNWVAFEIQNGAVAQRVLEWVFGEQRAHELAAFGRPYDPVGLVDAVAPAAAFSVDPNVIDRGTQAHATTQDALARFLLANGIAPRSPNASEPDFDLGWQASSRTFVAEVKSTTSSNEEAQLRLGLGQVLRYRHAVAARGEDVVAVLVPENRPADLAWRDLCASIGVILVWPSMFDELLVYGANSDSSEPEEPDPEA